MKPGRDGDKSTNSVPTVAGSGFPDRPAHNPRHFLAPPALSSAQSRSDDRQRDASRARNTAPPNITHRLLVRTIPPWVRTDKTLSTPPKKLAATKKQRRDWEVSQPEQPGHMFPVQLASVACQWKQFVTGSVSPWNQLNPPSRTRRGRRQADVPTAMSESMLPALLDGDGDGDALDDGDSDALDPVESDQELLPGLNDVDGKWGRDAERGSAWWMPTPAERQQLYKRIANGLIREPNLPLLVRLVVLVGSACALGLACSIFNFSKSAGCQSGSSTYLAIVVAVCAIVYTVGISYDEQMSMPLGLRPHWWKTMFLLVDLLFIVFQAANAAIAFAALADRQWACHSGDDALVRDLRASGLVTGVAADCPFDRPICERQKALSGMLVVTLVAWIITVSISVVRIIAQSKMS